MPPITFIYTELNCLEISQLSCVRLFAAPWTANTRIEKSNLRLLCWSNAWDIPFQSRGMSSIPDGEGGAKIHMPHGQKNQNKKQKQRCNKFNKDFKNAPHPPPQIYIYLLKQKKNANLPPKKMLS